MTTLERKMLKYLNKHKKEIEYISRVYDMPKKEKLIKVLCREEIFRRIFFWNFNLKAILQEYPDIFNEIFIWYKR